MNLHNLIIKETKGKRKEKFHSVKYIPDGKCFSREREREVERVREKIKEIYLYVIFRISLMTKSIPGEKEMRKENKG